MTQLNENTCRPRQALEAASRQYPGLWKNIDKVRALHEKNLKDWPKSCFIPTCFTKTIMNRFFIAHTNRHREQKVMAETARISALAAWRVTQGIYCFDADVYESVLSTPIDGGFPLDVLHRLPEWCVYIETQNLLFMGEKVYGAWIYIDYVAACNMSYLRMLIDTKSQLPIGLQLTREPIHEQLKKMSAQSVVEGGVDVHYIPGFTSSIVSLLTTLVSLALFLCTQAAAVGGDAHRPASAAPQRRQAGALRPLAPSSVTTWEVGVRMGAALRQARQRTAASEGVGENGPQNAPRGHIRRAHWHHAVSGPRKSPDGTVLSTAQRQLKVRWQPPLAINVHDAEALPATIRPVGSGAGAALPKFPGALASRPAPVARPAGDARRA